MDFSKPISIMPPKKESKKGKRGSQSPPQSQSPEPENRNHDDARSSESTREAIPAPVDLNELKKEYASVKSPSFFGGPLKDPLTTKSDKGSNGIVPSRPAAVLLRKRAQALLGTRQELPIWKGNVKIDLKLTLRTSDVLLVVGETGSGKSTQIPQFLMDEPWCKTEKVTVTDDDGNMKEMNVGGVIAVTEPRRVAVTSLASRVAAETGSYLGKVDTTKDDVVGYSIRFDQKIPKGCKIKYLTEGMLLQELTQDPSLKQYSAVIIDEIHERSMDVDLITGFLRTLVRSDKKGRGGVPMKVVIMSATADVEKLENFWNQPFEVESPAAVLDKSHKGVGSVTSSANKLIAPDESTTRDPEDRRPSDSSMASTWNGISSEDEEVTKPAIEKTDVLELDNSGITVQHIKGRQHKVTQHYMDAPSEDYIRSALATTFRVHTGEKFPGDILCFLPGLSDIEKLKGQIEETIVTLRLNNPDYKGIPDLHIETLYAAMPMEQQQKAIAPLKKVKKITRKVILATNIAETSITVPGVKYVIDCGFQKTKEFRPQLNLDTLLVKPISKSSAIQRTGRAGRIEEGKCYRLYTRSQFEKFEEKDKPEITRTNIISAVLKMKSLNVDDIYTFPFLDKPSQEAVTKALNKLSLLGALDDEGMLTDTGKLTNKLPISPEFARVLVGASEEDGDECLLSAIDLISAFTSGEDIFRQATTHEEEEQFVEARKDLIRREGEILTILTAMQKYASENGNRNEWCKKHHISSQNMKTAMAIRKQLRALCVKHKLLSELPAVDPRPFKRATEEEGQQLMLVFRNFYGHLNKLRRALVGDNKRFLAAFADQTAILHPDGGYHMTVGDRSVIAIHPSSTLMGKKMEAIMFLQHVYTSKNYAKVVTRVQAQWIYEALALGL